MSPIGHAAPGGTSPCHTPPPGHTSPVHVSSAAAHLRAIAVHSFDLPSGYTLPEHVHEVHQLAWSPNGVLTVTVGRRSWVLPSNLGLWIPAGVVHAPGARRSTIMQSAYFDPAACAVDWAEPTVVGVGPLARDLIGYLADPDLDAARRGRAERVLLDVLAPVSVATIDIHPPSDPRAAGVAAALTADPADNRSLEDWGHEVGASVRTLTRMFTAETGMTFAQFRTQVRLRAALAHLAEGAPIAAVARKVGYQSPSAFIVAFKRVTGQPPGSFFGTAPEDDEPGSSVA